jgi:hypothetical protein
MIEFSAGGGQGLGVWKGLRSSAALASCHRHGRLCRRHVTQSRRPATGKAPPVEFRACFCQPCGGTGGPNAAVRAPPRPLSARASRPPGDFEPPHSAAMRLPTARQRPSRAPTMSRVAFCFSRMPPAVQGIPQRRGSGPELPAACDPPVTVVRIRLEYKWGFPKLGPPRVAVVVYGSGIVRAFRFLPFLGPRTY